MDSVQALKLMFIAMVGLTIIAVISVWSSQNIVSAGNTAEDDIVISCHDDQRNFSTNRDVDLPIIYFITPTYPRREQVPELTRIGQTLMHVKNLHWIVADDNKECNPSLVKLLKKFGVSLTVMATPMPKVFWKRHKNEMPRGVANRRAALSWIRNHATNGVLYFGDDDNTFDLQLFDEIRYTKKVSMMPVGLIGDFGVSSPVVKKGKVIGFFDSWSGNRKFAIDMAGFAVSVQFLKQSPKATMPFKVGHEEDMFLKNLGLRMEDIEPVADECTKVLVWHTQSTNKPRANLRLAHEKSGTSLDKLINELYDTGIALSDSKTGVKTYYLEGIRRTEV